MTMTPEVWNPFAQNFSARAAPSTIAVFQRMQNMQDSAKNSYASQEAKTLTGIHIHSIDTLRCLLVT